MDTSGFYKQFDDGSWVFAPNFVCSKHYTLERDGNREEIDGWKWYDEQPSNYTNDGLIFQEDLQLDQEN